MPWAASVVTVRAWPSPDPPSTTGSSLRLALLLDRSARVLRAAGIGSPRLEAEVLLGALLGRSRAGLMAADRETVPPDVGRAMERAVHRRSSGTPLQYLTGVQEFRSLEFQVGPGVLIPRPETEVLVEASLKELPAGRPRIVDVGTGSGCIAVSLACARPDATVVGVDRSAEALQMAAGNAARLAPGAALHWLQGDLLEPLEGRFDLVVSNPPYVSRAEHAGLMPEVRDHEPREGRNSSICSIVS